MIPDIGIRAYKFQRLIKIDEQVAVVEIKWKTSKGWLLMHDRFGYDWCRALHSEGIRSHAPGRRVWLGQRLA